ncbi:MAG: DUF5597 domain-containing protein [Mangrovibacterium sp.]
MKKISLLILFLIFSGGFLAGQDTGNTGIPVFNRELPGTLMVGNKPFIMLAAEVNNSSSSSLAYMEAEWDKLVKMNCNTALVPVSWELLEPEEGRFDFTLVEGLINKAREHRLKLVFLWFGSWKNSLSTYVPEWVKKDTRRFPRAQEKPGVNMELLSPFGTESLKADSKAFSMLMRKIRELDEKERTVIMVQVENEVGIHHARDYSRQANKLYESPVPQELMTYLKKNKDRLTPELEKVWSLSDYKQSGIWPEVFPEDAPEIFMAWAYAKYINQVIEAGKKEYPLPMYVNAWIVQNNTSKKALKEGGYPQGGPVAGMINIWRAGAPLIDLYAPDIYLSHYKEICAEYNRLGNPLFIPENNNDRRSAAHAVYALSRHAAIGYGPFGIYQVPDGMPLSQAYQVLTDLMPYLVKYRGTPNMTGILLNRGGTEETAFMGYRVKARSLESENSGSVPANAMIIALGGDEFLITGANIRLEFYPAAKESNDIVATAWLEEGKFADGQWVPGRRLNGDERLVILRNTYKILRLKLYRYPYYQKE